VKALNNNVCKVAIVDLIVDLLKDKEVLQAVNELCIQVTTSPAVQQHVNALLIQSSQEVLKDPELVDQSKEFVAEVSSLHWRTAPAHNFRYTGCW
jgi:hypothetical protein